MVMESTALRSESADLSEVYDTPASVGGDTHRFVSFYVGETHYAVPAKDVAGVTNYLTPTPLPDSPPKLLGIAPHRGDIIGVIALEASVSAQPHGKNKSVVLRPFGSIEMPLAFNVDRLGELLQIRASEIYRASPEDPNADLAATVEGRPVLIIEPARLVDFLTKT